MAYQVQIKPQGYPTTSTPSIEGPTPGHCQFRHARKAPLKTIEIIRNIATTMQIDHHIAFQYLPRQFRPHVFFAKVLEQVI
jgi:hypothetical protein